MIKPGMFIAERYEIIDKVGSGGMADVYKARCHKLNRFVAIKVLKQEFSTDESFVDKFRAEAQSAAGLSHPNIVNVYDVGEENGMYYIVMELIEGITLKSFIERKNRLDIREATGIAIQIAQGLEAAHANNIIHRDIKPQNIIISRDGKVKVADFGIAKAASSNTLTSSAMGSVHYISPEQARGGYSDEKSDIYSLGITMYEMILGKVPFEGDNAVSIALLHIQEEAPTLGELMADVPISTDKIVLKCLQKKPERRYLSVVELINDLKRSLVEPNVDFVVIPDALNNSPTIALSPNDVNAIRQGAMQQEMKQEMQPMQQPMMQGNNHKPGIDRNDNSPNYGQQMGNDNNMYDDSFVDPEEEKVDDKLEKVTKIGAIIIVVFIIGILIYLLVGNKGGNDNGNENDSQSAPPTQIATLDPNTMIDVEGVVGKTEEDAKEILERLGFVVNIKYVPLTDEKYSGLVVSQSVEEGVKHPKGGAITLEVEKEGATEIPVEEKSMPDITGLSTKKGEDKLKDLFDSPNLFITYKTINDDSIPVGNIVRTEPSSGAKVTNKSKIVIYISKGADNKATIPSLFGCSRREAEQKLAAEGLKLGDVEEVSDGRYGNDFVIGQTHEAGSTTERNSRIGIRLNVIDDPTDEPETEEPQPVEKTYKVSITMSVSGEYLFDDQTDACVVVCNFSCKGRPYSSSSVTLQKSSYGGSVTISMELKSTEDISESDIERIKYSFTEAARGDEARNRVTTTAISVSQR